MKTIYSKSATVLLLILSMQLVQAQNLVAYYPFSGNAADSSGNGYDGRDSNVVLTTDRFGMAGKAYSFNGNGMIDIPTIALQNNNYTYSVWAKIANLPASGAGMALLSIGNGSAIGDQHIFLGNQYSTPVLTGFAAGSYTNPSQFPLPPNIVKKGSLPQTNQWYHLVAVRDTVRRKLSLFIDGVKIGEDTLKIWKAGYAIPCKGNIGVRVPGNFQYFKGTLDDIRIYNYAFTDADVITLYNTEKVATGVASISAVNHSLNVYPNPSNGVVNVTANNFAGMLNIFNAQGLLVHTQTEFDGATEIAGLNAGVYFCAIEDYQGNREVIKFIITE
ncbi:MAG: LamG-like jellyroll fold domain-containing protein [Bacteroidota bacterium]